MADRITSLNKKRGALRHKLESLRAIAEKQLDALMETRLKMRELDRDIAVLDRSIGSIIDNSLSNLDKYHDRVQEDVI